MGELLGLIRKVRAALKDGVTIREFRVLLAEALKLWDQIDPPGTPVVVGALESLELTDADVDAALLEYGTVSAASTDAEAIPGPLAVKLLKWAVKALVRVLL